jgi:hypothetical protein
VKKQINKGVPQPCSMIAERLCSEFILLHLQEKVKDYSSGTFFSYILHRNWAILLKFYVGFVKNVEKQEKFIHFWLTQLFSVTIIKGVNSKGAVGDHLRRHFSYKTCLHLNFD